MTRVKQCTATIGLLLLAAAGCSDSERLVAPGGSGEADLSASTTPTGWMVFPFRGFDDCTGEWVSGEQRTQVVIERDQDAAGGDHFHAVINRKGTLAGEDTGITYRYNSIQTLTSNGDVAGVGGKAYETNFQARIRLVAQGAAEDRIMFINSRFVNSANGVIVVDEDERHVTCLP